MFIRIYKDQKELVIEAEDRTIRVEWNKVVKSSPENYLAFDLEHDGEKDA